MKKKDIGIKERWFNYRPLCLVFLGLIGGSLFAFFITRATLITIVALVISLLIFIFFAIRNKNLCIILIPLIALVIGSVYFNFKIYTFNKPVISETPTLIETRIYSLKKEKTCYITAYSDSVKFNNKTVNTNLFLIIFDTNNLFDGIDVGSVISFSPNKFLKTDLMYYETPNSTDTFEHLKYTVYVDINDVTLLGNNKTLAEKIKFNIKDNLTFGLTNENVELIYSAMFGEKQQLSDNQYNAYKTSGVAHLLAVSGLHVGIIAMIINFILRLVKIEGWWKFSIVAILLLLYTYICGFSNSILRATIMSLVLIGAPLVFREYDSFSAISLAGIIVFAINPLMAFSVGAIMSFSCVIGIALFNKSFTAVMRKLKFPKWLSDSLSLSLSAVVILLIIMAYYFQTINIISLVANIIIIPLFTICFAFSMIIGLISLILPVVSYALVPINYFINFINQLIIIFSNLLFTNIGTVGISFIAIYAYLALMIFMSRFCTAKVSHKTILCTTVLAILVACLL